MQKYAAIDAIRRFRPWTWCTSLGLSAETPDDCATLAVFRWAC